MASVIPSDLLCTICKDLTSEECLMLDPCEHTFCKDCINPVLNGETSNRECPNCRASISRTKKPMFQFLNALKAYRKKLAEKVRTVTRIDEDFESISLWSEDSRLSASADGQRFQIFIRDLGGKDRVVWVTANESVLSLKQKVKDKTNIPPEHQRLLYGGKQFKDQELLSLYNLEHGSTVHLVMRLVGGFN